MNLNYIFNYYLPNQPDQAQYKTCLKLSNLSNGEVSFIIEKTGNHWRKIFSIMAKISCYSNKNDMRWQDYRDKILLTKEGLESVYFSGRTLDVNSEEKINIIVGNVMAEKLIEDIELFQVIGKQGKIFRYKSTYIVPYLDYRQFPNNLIEELINSINRG